MSEQPFLYHYDEVTGLLLYSTVADRDPMVADRWVVPHSSTLLSPPEPMPGFAARFAEGTWGYVPVDDVDTEPTPDPIVTGDMVNAFRDMLIASGTTILIADYGPVPLQGREKDQTNLLGLMNAAKLRIEAGDLTTLRKFRDAANVDHMLTPPQFIELWAKGSAWISDVYEASWDLKDMSPIPLDYTDSQYWP